jgi:UDP-N-acetylglucosamine--N-acetylmuramyl-(pentapeptide) pyrophosphoryl-undecaprenol N-acetylglucosamine transferase
MTASEPLRVMIAGGGTGGHLFPGIAVAEALRRIEPKAEILFVGTPRPFEKRAVEGAGFSHRAVSVEGFLGRGRRAQARALARLVAATARCQAMVLGFGPHVVLGVGGYASVPCVFGAWTLGKKTALAEQNVWPGVANRTLRRFARRVYVSFEESVKQFPKNQVLVTGNPVRESLFASEADDKSPSDCRVPEEAAKLFCVLVLGGSQGARGLNVAVVEGLSLLDNPEEIFIIHQTGDADFEKVAAAYNNWKGKAWVAPFFADMRACYRHADLVICRAGATTVAEITALGKAAIFVPFPQAAQNHQEKNARVLEYAGAAQVILERNLSGRVVAERIRNLAADRQALADMQSRSRALGKPGAAGAVAHDLVNWVRGDAP